MTTSIITTVLTGYFLASYLWKEYNINQYANIRSSEEQGHQLCFVKAWYGRVDVYECGNGITSLTESEKQKEKLAAVDNFLMEEDTGPVYMLAERLVSLQQQPTVEQRDKEILASVGSMEPVATTFFLPGVSSITIIDVDANSNIRRKHVKCGTWSWISIWAI